MSKSTAFELFPYTYNTAGLVPLPIQISFRTIPKFLCISPLVWTIHASGKWKRAILTAFRFLILAYSLSHTINLIKTVTNNVFVFPIPNSQSQFLKFRRILLSASIIIDMCQGIFPVTNIPLGIFKPYTIRNTTINTVTAPFRNTTLSKRWSLCRPFQLFVCRPYTSTTISA